MKTSSILSIPLFFFYFLSYSQITPPITLPKVDQRVELLSIVFRLAESDEYNSDRNLNYVQSIHAHFDKFKEHPLIEYAKKIQSTDNIGYDAVMSMAVHLKEPPDLTPVVPFSSNSLDNRWSVKTATRFNELLKQFYKDADCETFFKRYSDNYTIAEQRFSSLFKKLDIEWYPKFYGKAPNENFNTIVGLGNGTNNYGPNVTIPTKTKEVYAIIGASTFDSIGLPKFEVEDHLPTLIHEFNHSFVNYLIDLHEKQLSAAGKIIFDKVGDRMKKQHYTKWKIVLSEALVRASVIRYLISHELDTLIADRELKNQLARGFVWMRELVALLEQYENEREQYPTLESFMPRVVSFYDAIASQIEMLDTRYLQQCAKVISVQPFDNNETGVRADITEIVFNFDKKLDGVRYFIGPGKEYKPYKLISISFANDNKSIVMKVELEPNAQYQINMHGSFMRTEDGYSVQNYSLNFKTGEKSSN